MFLTASLDSWYPVNGLIVWALLFSQGTGVL